MDTFDAACKTIWPVRPNLASLTKFGGIVSSHGNKVHFWRYSLGVDETSFIKRLIITYRVWIHSKTRKWLSVRLRTKWLWVWISLLSLKSQIWLLLRARSSLTFRETIESGFTLKLIRDMIIINSQMHLTDKYSQRSQTFGQFG